jgi:hypothetical protein
MSALLVGKIRIAQRGDASLVPPVVEQPPTQLGACRPLAPGQDERSVSEINERNLTAILDTPAMSKPGRQTRLTPVGHFRGRDMRRHTRIVSRANLQGGLPRLWLTVVVTDHHAAAWAVSVGRDVKASSNSTGVSLPRAR